MKVVLSPGLLTECRLAGQRLAEAVKLPLLRKIWRGASGDFAGAGTGNSMEFQDHRAYQAGDDPRHLNWQAYARTGQFTMKVFRQEVRPMVDVVCDVSSSQFLHEAKTRRVLELLYFCVTAAEKAGAAAKVFLLNGTQSALLTSEILASPNWPDRLPVHAPAGLLGEMPGVARLPFRSQSLRIFLSDLLYPGSPDSVLGPLSAHGGRGLIFAPFSATEASVDWDGNHEFVEVESGQRQVRRVTPTVLRRYHEAYQRHFDLWKTSSRRHGIPMARVAAEGDLLTAIQAEAALVGVIEAG